MNTKLPSHGNHIFINYYPQMTPYQGYDTLVCPYLSARFTIEFDIPMAISWDPWVLKQYP